MRPDEVVRAGIRAAAGSGVRLLLAGGLLFSSLMVWLFLALFPGTGEGSLRPGDLFRALLAHEDRTLLVLFFVSTGILLWAVWSALAGGVLRLVVLAIRGKPLAVAAALQYGLRRWATFFFTPILFLLAVSLGAFAVYALTSLCRVPVVGWPVFLLLSPLIFLLALTVVRFAARYAIGGHLAGPAIAAGDCGAFTALQRVSAWARRAPARLALANLLALLQVLLHSSWRVILIGAAFGLIGLGIDWRDSSDLAEICVWPLLLAGASWLLAWPMALLLGSRVGLYLAHRNGFDGVAIDAVELDPVREKSLEELGFELVLRLRKEEE